MESYVQKHTRVALLVVFHWIDKSYAEYGCKTNAAYLNIDVHVGYYQEETDSERRPSRYASSISVTVWQVDMHKF